MGVDSKFSNIGSANLFELFNESIRFMVPLFQRNYAWKPENVDTLWCDLMTGFQKDKKENIFSQKDQYLLGPIVLVKDSEEENKYWVIDGQQRLSTITLLFCVARDIVRENIGTKNGRNPEGYEKIMEMLENVNNKNEHMNWKLVLNDTDQDLFRQIQEYEDEPTTQLERIKKLKLNPQSQKLLADNYVRLHGKLMAAILTDFNDEDCSSTIKHTLDMKEQDLVKQNLSSLNYFLKYTTRNNFVVKIVVKDDDAAYQIFETLNFRGRTLLKSNLIKNHILKIIKNKEEQRKLSDSWNNIFKEKEISQDEGDDAFILESFRSRNYETDDKASLRNLFIVIRKVLKNEEDVRKYITALTEDKEFLIKLYNPDSYTDSKTKDDICAIQTLKAKSIRATILAAYRKWHDTQIDDYRRLVHFLTRFFFNQRIICKMHAGAIEKKMLDTIKCIENGESLQSILYDLRQDYDHDDFKHNFRKFIKKVDANEAKYILRQIAIDMQKPYSDVEPTALLSLEHVLPKKPAKWNSKKFFANYRGESDLKFQAFTNNLGNLTLLHSTVNRQLQNEEFLVKKNGNSKYENGYSTSSLEINRQTICNHDEWTAVIIENRANQLAERAFEIWDLKKE